MDVAFEWVLPYRRTFAKSLPIDILDRSGEKFFFFYSGVERDQERQGAKSAHRSCPFFTISHFTTRALATRPQRPNLAISLSDPLKAFRSPKLVASLLGVACLTQGSLQIATNTSPVYHAPARWNPRLYSFRPFSSRIRTLHDA